MALKVFAAGVGKFEGYAPDGTKVIDANSMTETTVEITSAVEEIRGGEGAGLIGKYFHSSNMSLTATDALFDLNYLAFSFGTDIVESNVENLDEENVTITTANQITVVGNPINFGNAGLIGWYKLSENDEDWKLIKFNNKIATVDGLSVGTKVCVRYNAIDDSAREIIVPTNVASKEIKAIIRQDLFLGQQGKVSTYSKVGELVIEIPRFQFNPDQTLSMNMTGASTVNLGGNALVVRGSSGCGANNSYYAKIKEVILNRKFYEDSIDLAIVGGVLQKEDTISVMAIKNNGTNKLLLPTQLSYTLDPSNGATIDETTGKISEVTADCILTVKIKDGTNPIPAPYNSLEGMARIDFI